MAFYSKIFQFFDVFSDELMHLTILKAGEIQKYESSSKTFNLYAPKCPNLRKILPHVFDLKMCRSLRNKQTLLYHSL
jgi:hypothetical protein